MGWRLKAREFSVPTKRTLACRSGYNCNLCWCNTIWPNLDDFNKVTPWWEAWHIISNAEKGPRCNPNMSDEDVRSILNGIWLCRNCHKKVDCNESTFTVEDLQEKKSVGERKAWESLPRNTDNMDDLKKLLISFNNKLSEHKLYLRLEEYESARMTITHRKTEDKEKYNNITKEMNNINSVWKRDFKPIVDNIFSLIDCIEWKKIKKLWLHPRSKIDYIYGGLLDDIINFLNKKKIKHKIDD